MTLTLDLALQRTAEALLDSACQRRDALSADARASGGAVVILDVHSGAVLAAASAPRFDPNWFAAAGQARSEEQVARLLTDPAHPLFDRVCRMALSPGSVFKPITAAALLEAAKIDPHAPIHCQGYLHRTDAQRCMIYTRRGIGHGEVNLSDALAMSCNVYFFQAAGAMGPQPLCDWAARFGLGRPTGIDLPGESAGHVPQPDAGPWKLADTQALAIGQSRLTVTPLQMARVMAAIANGGLLVHPHILNSISPDEGLTETIAPQPIAGLTPQTLAALHDGLKRVVADPCRQCSRNRVPGAPRHRRQDGHGPGRRRLARSRLVRRLVSGRRSQSRAGRRPGARRRRQPRRRPRRPPPPRAHAPARLFRSIREPRRPAPR